MTWSDLKCILLSKKLETLKANIVSSHSHDEMERETIVTEIYPLVTQGSGKVGEWVSTRG